MDWDSGLADIFEPSYSFSLAQHIKRLSEALLPNVEPKSWSTVPPMHCSEAHSSCPAQSDASVHQSHTKFLTPGLAPCIRRGRLDQTCLRTTSVQCSYTRSPFTSVLRLSTSDSESIDAIASSISPTRDFHELPLLFPLYSKHRVILFVSKRSYDFDEGRQIGTCDRIDITTTIYFPDRGLCGDAANWLRPSLPFPSLSLHHSIFIYSRVL
jgi:hypothetical protein